MHLAKNIYIKNIPGEHWLTDMGEKVQFESQGRESWESVSKYEEHSL